MLTIRLDESWTHHSQLGLAKVFKFQNSYNDGTPQNFQKYVLDSSNQIATSITKETLTEVLYCQRVSE